MKKIEPYTYDLVESRIAQRPVRPAHDAKLLVIDRVKREISESTFYDLPSLLRPEDLLIFNNTKVIPARFFGSMDGLSTEVEILIVREVEKHVFCCIGRPLKRFKEGRIIRFEGGLEGHIRTRVSDKEVLVQFMSVDPGRDVDELMGKDGTMPIPPYIRHGHADEEDRTDYQTIFAEVDGSIAAPTASLHFTPELMDKVSGIGCSVEFLTLHVGTASFLPLYYDDKKGFNPPGKEEFFVSAALIEKIKESRARGGRVIAVGTTAVRALESAARAPEGSGSTELFIQPGFEFLHCDSVVTNFHQPGTTHLLLVEALLGRDLLNASYKEALSRNFRFLSYGDGMLVL